MKRLLCIFLTLFLLCPTIHAQEEGTLLIAGSDYQGSSDEESSQNVKEILEKIKEDGYTNPEGFLFVGDYSRKLEGKVEDSNSGIHSLQETIHEEYPSLKEDHIILSQGNHDVEKCEYNSSGLYEYETYSVYVINEKEYRWQAGKKGGPYYEEIARNTAQQVKESLEQKIKENDKKPIFVLCHIPLHLTIRTQEYGDGEYGRYIFDVLNEAGKQGLNLFFLYGHNHSKGCENYLGGASVYLQKGDSILIPVLGTKTGVEAQEEVQYTEEILSFTYMNAGYVGYFNDAKESDSCLTMTTFIIDENKVEVRRYSKEGVHELKSKGISNNSYPAQSNKDRYSSAQYVFLEEKEFGFQYWIEKIQNIKKDWD